MSHSSMHTFLQEAFTSCLQADTHATESGLTVSVAKKKDETILFVQTDNDHARKYLQMPAEDEQSCDRLILYARKNNSKNELYCYLELKGKDLSHAVNQISNTHKYMLPLINTHVEKKQHIFLKQCACICCLAPSLFTTTFSRSHHNMTFWQYHHKRFKLLKYAIIVIYNKSLQSVSLEPTMQEDGQ